MSLASTDPTIARKLTLASSASSIGGSSASNVERTNSTILSSTIQKYGKDKYSLPEEQQQQQFSRNQSYDSISTIASRTTTTTAESSVWTSSVAGDNSTLDSSAFFTQASDRNWSSIDEPRTQKKKISSAASVDSYWGFCKYMSEDLMHAVDKSMEKIDHLMFGDKSINTDTISSDNNNNNDSNNDNNSITTNGSNDAKDKNSSADEEPSSPLPHPKQKETHPVEDQKPLTSRIPTIHEAEEEEDDFDFWNPKLERYGVLEEDGEDDEMDEISSEAAIYNHPDVWL